MDSKKMNQEAHKVRRIPRNLTKSEMLREVNKHLMTLANAHNSVVKVLNDTQGELVKLREELKKLQGHISDLNQNDDLDAKS